MNRRPQRSLLVVSSPFLVVSFQDTSLVCSSFFFRRISRISEKRVTDSRYRQLHRLWCGMCVGPLPQILGLEPEPHRVRCQPPHCSSETVSKIPRLLTTGLTPGRSRIFCAPGGLRYWIGRRASIQRRSYGEACFAFLLDFHLRL